MSENVIILEFENSRDKMCGAQNIWPPGLKQIFLPKDTREHDLVQCGQV